MLAADLVARQGAHDRVRAVAQQRGGDAQVPARQARGRRARPDAHHGLSRRLSARDAPRDRARAARRRDPLRGRHQRARARHRHRRARRGGVRRLPGLGRGARGSASAARGGAASASIAVLVTSSAPLDQYLAREPGVPARRAGRGGAHRSRQRRDPRPAPEVRGLRAALRGAARRLRDAPAPSDTDARRSRFLGASTGWCTSRTSASTGRPTRTPPTTCRLRSVGWDNVVIIDRATTRPSPRSTGAPRTRCCTSRPSTSTTASSIRSRGSTTRTTRPSSRKVVPDYFTDAMTYRKVSVIEEERSARRWGRARVGVGRGVASSRRSSATRRSSSTPTRTPATATCACPRCRCTRRRSGSPCRRRLHRVLGMGAPRRSRAARRRRRAGDGRDARAHVRSARPRANPGRQKPRERPWSRRAISIRRCFFSITFPGGWDSPNVFSS